MEEAIESPRASCKNEATQSSNIRVSLDKVKKDRPKRTLVTAACEECRARKAKCDGARPRCSRCTRVRKTCIYSVNPGETRQAAAKLKSESLQKDFDSVYEILDALRSVPLSEARELLDSLRASQDAPSFLETYKTSRKITTEGSPLTSTSSRSSISIGKDQVFSDASCRSSGSSSASSDPQTSSTKDYGREDRLGVLPAGLTLPPEPLLREAVKGFFAGSGKLFHVFSNEVLNEYLDELFRSERKTISRNALCELCCVASVGALYLPKPCGFENDMYNIARTLLDNTIQEDILGSAKCCTLLAMFNLMSKITVAMTYIELGMDLSRRYFELANGTNCPRNLWIDGKRTRRSLVFLGCWISSTLGYVSSNDWMLTEQPFEDLEIEGESAYTNVVQTEMIKVAIVKQAIVRISDGSSIESLQSIRANLRDWHQEMPPGMRLTNLIDNPEITSEILVSIYTVHLLYLGASILFYRQLLNQSESATGAPSKLLDQAHTDAVTAAQQSSRILNLLFDVGGVTQRCWLSIHQSYCSSMLILHGIAENFIQGTSASSTLISDLEQARRCLDILKFCAQLDTVAAQFVDILTPYHDYLANLMAAPFVGGSNTKMRLICTELFDLVRRPFGQVDRQQDGGRPNGRPSSSASIGWQSNPGDKGESINTLLCQLGPPKWLNGRTPHGWKDDSPSRAVIKHEQSPA